MLKPGLKSLRNVKKKRKYRRWKEKKIRRLTKVSSRKSIESANNETELIFTAADNSIKKYVKFNNATINKVRLKELIFKDLLFLLKVYFYNFI